MFRIRPLFIYYFFLLPSCLILANLFLCLITTSPSPIPTPTMIKQTSLTHGHLSSWLNYPHTPHTPHTPLVSYFTATKSTEAKQSHVSSVIGTSLSTSTTTGHCIRLLVPVTASGPLIGRGGANIKQLNESSGCKIKLADNSDSFKTQERIVILQSNAIPVLIKVRIII